MKWVCDSCGVEFVDAIAEGDGIVHRIQDCESCCPQYYLDLSETPEE